MRVAVFGGAGFIGKNILEKFNQENIEFVASDVIDSFEPVGGIYKKADITQKDQVENVIDGCDYVVHLAAHPLGPSVKNPFLNAKINILGSLNILDIAKEKGCKQVIFSSASSLYGAVDGDKVKEENMLTPKTPYAVTKLTLEHYLRVYKELYGLNYLVFRFFNVYGPHQYAESGGLVPNILKRIHNENPVTLFGDGSAARDFIYVKDIANFYAAAITQDVKNQILNMGTGNLTTIKEFFDIAAKVVGKELKVEQKEERPGEISNYAADVENLRKAFGKVPETTLEQGLNETYEWIKTVI